MSSENMRRPEQVQRPLDRHACPYGRRGSIGPADPPCGEGRNRKARRQPRPLIRQRDSLSGVLVFHTGSLGDTIISIPALRAIRKHWRGQEITLLHNATPVHLAGPEELLSELGLVDKFLTYPATGGSLRRMIGAIRCLCTLRRKQFDTVIYLLRDRPADSVRRDGIYFALAGIKVRLGFAAGGNANSASK